MVEPTLKVWGHGCDLMATAGCLRPSGRSSIPAESLGIQFESGNPLEKFPAFIVIFYSEPQINFLKFKNLN